ncbi:MAG: hypothetical protein JXJ30_06335 [Halothiobacillaceae bacterium]|nr:hypothetical protein [Halothiobacillaceae bacterium]HER34334.1 hypothetical protein [Halothiobacillaceae bacterium]
MPHTRPFAAFVATLLLTAPLLTTNAIAAEAATSIGIEAGEPFPSWELDDQHGKTHQLPGQSTTAIVFSRSKQADGALSPVLEDVVGERLIDEEVVYLSDISRMPGLISRVFALPSLRDRSYPVVLIREEGLSEPLVTETDCLALYRIERGTVVGREGLCNEEDVRGAF